MVTKVFHHALKILDEVCIGCTHCMKACPTEALRVKDGKALLMADRCIDCGKCMQVCPVHAIIIEQDDFQDIFKYPVRVALVPSVLIGQFPRHYAARKIYSGLMEQGFTHVYEAEHGASILIDQINHYLKAKKETRPVISSFCPAIVRLIQVRFPSLVEHIILLKAPLDLAALSFRKELVERGVPETDIGIFYVTPCAAKIAAIKSPVGEDTSPITGVIKLDDIFNKVYLSFRKEEKASCIVPEKEQLRAEEMEWSLTGGEARHIQGRCLSIDGIMNAIEFLEQIENGSAVNFDFIELRACDESCAGGILTTANRFLISERLRERALKYQSDMLEGRIFDNKSIDRHSEYVIERVGIESIEHRSMLKLDENMDLAMSKMDGIRKLTQYLPGIDCGGCGAPSCKALAEDIMQGHARTSDCIFVQNTLAAKPGKAEKAEKIWGKNRFNNLIP